MLATSLLVAVSSVGVQTGYQPTTGGGVEYVIQIEPEVLQSLRGGEELTSAIPPEIGAVERFRVRVGNGALPRQLPESPAANHAQPDASELQSSAVKSDAPDSPPGLQRQPLTFAHEDTPTGGPAITPLSAEEQSEAQAHTVGSAPVGVPPRGGHSPPMFSPNTNRSAQASRAAEEQQQAIASRPRAGTSQRQFVSPPTAQRTGQAGNQPLDHRFPPDRSHFQQADPQNSGPLSASDGLRIGDQRTFGNRGERSPSDSAAEQGPAARRMYNDMRANGNGLANSEHNSPMLLQSPPNATPGNNPLTGPELLRNSSPQWGTLNQRQLSQGPALPAAESQASRTVDPPPASQVDAEQVEQLLEAMRDEIQQLREEERQRSETPKITPATHSIPDPQTPQSTESHLDGPSSPMLAAVIGIFLIGSLGANFYLAWIWLETRRRYQLLVHDRVT